MAVGTILVSSLTTGIGVAGETIGTGAYQQVKLVGGAAGDTTGVGAGGSIPVSQVAAVSVSSIVPVTTAASVSVSGLPVWLNPTQQVSMSTLPVVSMTGALVSVVSTVLGTVLVSEAAAVSISGITPVTTAASVSVSGVPVWINPTQGVNVSTVSTLLGTVNVNVAAAGTTLPVNIVAGGAAPGTTFTGQTSNTAQLVWLAQTQTLSLVSTVVTVLGTVNVNLAASGITLAASQVAAVSLSSIVPVTTAASVSVSGLPVWLNPTQGINISTITTILGTQVVSVVPGVSVLASITVSAVLGTVVTILGTQVVSVVPGVSVLASITVSAVLGTVVTVLGTVLVSEAAAVSLSAIVPVTTAASVSVSGLPVWINPTQQVYVGTVTTLLGTVNVSQAVTIVGGYMMAAATTTAINSSTNVLLMTVFNSTNSTLATSCWTVGSGSALVVYALNWVFSQPATNQATLMLLVTNTGATLSTAAAPGQAWAQVTFSAAGALATVLSSGWVPGSLVAAHSSITTLQYPWIIPGPAVVGVAVAVTTSGATVNCSIQASVVGSVPFIQPVVLPNTTLTVFVANSSNASMPAAGAAGLVVLSKEFARTAWVCAISSTVVGSSTTLAMTIWTGNTTNIGSTTAYAVPANQHLRITALQLGVQSSVAAAFQQFAIIVATATASLSVTATVGVALIVGYVPLAASQVNGVDLWCDIGTGTTICAAIIAGTSHTILGGALVGFLYSHG